MHSAYELIPFGGPVSWVGNWGLDDGMGEMDSIAPDLWQITIDPWAYYGLAPGTSINGLFILFRNEDGTATGRDDLDNDIFLDLSTGTPFSSFAGISAEWIRDELGSMLWSTAETTYSIEVYTAGTYSVSVMDTIGCIVSDTVEVAFGSPMVVLGEDTTFCSGSFSIDLDAGAGFSAYVWSTGASTQMITVSSAGMVGVSVTDSNGCIASDSLMIDNTSFNVDLGSDTSLCDTVFSLEPAFDFATFSDSLVIIYDATQGSEWFVGSRECLFPFRIRNDSFCRLGIFHWKLGFE